jgi:hypothetical protein
MPSGVETFVDSGFATIDFVDSSLRGPGLAKLIAIGGPESVETITRDGPRRKYRVPEGNASEAGLIDNPVTATAHGDLKYAQALADADPVADGGIYSPEVHTVKGSNDAGPVQQAQVVSNQSVSTTESGVDAPAEALAPPHAEVIANVKKMAQSRRKAPAARKRAGKSGAPTIAAQKAAQSSDPQSRPEGM